MRRPLSEGLSNSEQVDAVGFLERSFSDPVLLGMMELAQADGVAIRWLEAGAAVGAAANMGALDRKAGTARRRAVMAPHPGAVGGAGAVVFTTCRPDPRWQIASQGSVLPLHSWW